MIELITYNAAMRQLLKLHPASRSLPIAQIEVEVGRPTANRLVLSYMLTGTIREICIPPVKTMARSDKLWQQTCFEAFVRAPQHAGYYEFNFSPSTQWAAYHFSGYRSGMSPATEVEVVAIEVQSSLDGYTMHVSLELHGLPELLNGPWHLGLSAIVEDATGAKSYWALAHPPGKPDFHQADCFTLELAPDRPS